MIYVGSTKISEIFGGETIKEAYWGDQLVYSSTPSIQDGYWVHKDTDEITYFGLDAAWISGTTYNRAPWHDDAKEINVPQGVTIINSNGFAGVNTGSTQLEILTLPDSVVEMGSNCINNTAGLLIFNMHAVVPPKLTNPGDYIGNLSTELRVPYESVNVYKTTGPIWSLFSPYIIPFPEDQDSYYITTAGFTTAGTKYYFKLSDTPISNLSTHDDPDLSITINGQSVVKNTIKEIYFGESYNGVSNIGDAFLAVCDSLTSIDLSGLSNVTNIGEGFLYDCPDLTSIDLSPLSNVTSIGAEFLYFCVGLTTLTMGAETPPTLGVWAFSDTPSLSLIQVPCGSENDYKSATNWIAKESIIEGDC